jgi:carboxymethylenebutenolidase
MRRHLGQVVFTVRALSWPRATLSLLVSLVALGLGADVTHAQTPPQTAAVRKTAETFRSGGRPIVVWRFEPAAAGKYPAVLLLPGLDSMASQQQVLEQVARRYAGNGYVVVLVHYLDRLGAEEADVKATRARFKAALRATSRGNPDGQSVRQFQAWQTAVRDAVTYARTLDRVDGERVGLVGFSLGAYLAVAAAAEEDLRVAAVIDFFGGLPRALRPGVRRLPPTLIIHGDGDEVVPVEEAHALADLLAARHVPHEVQVYPGVGHVFGDNRGGFAWAAAQDAEARASAFLDKHLRRATRGSVAASR